MLYFCVIGFVSWIIGVLGLCQIVGTFRTLQYRKVGTSIITVSFWIIVLTTVATIVHVWFNEYKVAFYIAMAISLLLSWNTGKNVPETLPIISGINTLNVKLILLRSSGIVSFGFAIFGIYSCPYDTYTVIACGCITLVNSLIQVLWGGQNNLNTEILTIIIGFIIASIFNLPVFPCVFLCLCVADVLLAVLGWLWALISYFRRR